MRRPTATTVSAARMYEPLSSSSTRTRSSAASALARASRLAQARGSSPRCGVSSTLAGRSASASMPAWLMSVTRRGEPDARTSLGRPIMCVCAAARWDWSAGGGSFEPIGDTTFGHVVGRHLDQHLVAGEHADAVLAHAARGMGDDFMFVFELDAEGGVREQLRHDTGKFQELFFGHSLSSIEGIGTVRTD